jgi:hypothetical protein
MMLLSLDDFSLLFGIVKQETRCAGSSLIWIYSSALAQDMPCRIQTKPDGASRRTKKEQISQQKMPTNPNKHDLKNFQLALPPPAVAGLVSATGPDPPL